MALCIKELREKKGMTQSELARVSGISRQTIINLECGTTPSAMSSTLIKLADALDCSIDDFFTR